ncbi:MAG: hypothetical protein AAB368_15725 [bacterium]
MKGAARNLRTDEDGMTPDERLEIVVDLRASAVIRVISAEFEERVREIVKTRTVVGYGTGQNGPKGLTSGKPAKKEATPSRVASR